MTIYKITIVTIADDERFSIYTDVFEITRDTAFDALATAKNYAYISLDQHKADYIKSINIERTRKEF